MQDENADIKRQQGWYSDSIRIKNRSTQLPLQQLKNHAEQLKGTLQFENCNKIILIPLITQITFSLLISLDLSNNSLHSIDGLCNLQAPNLKEIRICHNFVTTVKNLRRGNWPNLLFLNLKQNKILDYQYLTQLHLKNNFESLTIATRKESYKKPRQDITWLVKLEINTIHNINHYLDTKRYYYQQENSDLLQILEKKLKVISRKFTNQNVFETSNCYDLN